MGDAEATTSITVRADGRLIDEAVDRARTDGTTLEELVRSWLLDYVRRGGTADDAMEIIARIGEKVRTGGRRFTRDEMNER